MSAVSKHNNYIVTPTLPLLGHECGGKCAHLFMYCKGLRNSSTEGRNTGASGVSKHTRSVSFLLFSMARWMSRASSLSTTSFSNRFVLKRRRLDRPVSSVATEGSCGAESFTRARTGNVTYQVKMRSRSSRHNCANHLHIVKRILVGHRANVWQVSVYSATQLVTAYTCHDRNQMTEMAFPG
jgi:hypothetical protein